MLDYDDEAARYDHSRGGRPRARAAAEACAALLPAGGAVLDLAVGTGIVAVELADLGHRVVGVDLSRQMLAVAVTRLPGAVAAANARALPIGSGRHGQAEAGGDDPLYPVVAFERTWQRSTQQ